MFNNKLLQKAWLLEGESCFYYRDNPPVHGRVCVVGLMTCSALVVAYQDKSGREKLYVSHLPSGSVSSCKGKIITELKQIVSESNGSEIKAVYWSGTPADTLENEVKKVDDILLCKTNFPRTAVPAVVIDFKEFSVYYELEKYSLVGVDVKLNNKM